MKQITAIIVMALFAFALILTGCGNSPVGRWETSSQFLIIRSDGSAVTGQIGGLTATATWSKDTKKTKEGYTIYLVKYDSGGFSAFAMIGDTLRAPDGSILYKK